MSDDKPKPILEKDQQIAIAIGATLTMLNKTELTTQEKVIAVAGLTAILSMQYNFELALNKQEVGDIDEEKMNLFLQSLGSDKMGKA